MIALIINAYAYVWARALQIQSVAAPGKVWGVKANNPPPLHLMLRYNYLFRCMHVIKLFVRLYLNNNSKNVKLDGIKRDRKRKTLCSNK